jgi:glutamate N-acetyltransferase/amino-acid N-acetyltransferase
MESLARIEGGITAPKGFTAGSASAGIKGKKPDVAVVFSETQAALAGTFTTNRVQAACVKLCRERLGTGRARAIVVNSGNANAWTGPQGIQDARQMADVAADALGVDAGDVCVCSTGTIGVPMPMDKVESGIRTAAGALSPEAGADAARAIMTTDTVPKEAAVETTIAGTPVRIGGMAKGSGMIEPNMATMLAFLTTDACVEQGALQACLSGAVDRSFNRITVDGDQSTNDTVLLLANGAAGSEMLTPDHADWPVFEQAVCEVTLDLALKIVKDGEGATKFVTVTVTGAASDEDAQKAARAIANSLLVKTSWFGEDPNWGRVVDALGYAGAQVAEERVDVCYDNACAVKHGVANAEVSTKELEAVLKQDAFSVTVDLHLGQGTDTVYTCDCSYDYVKINAEYTT